MDAIWEAKYPKKKSLATRIRINIGPFVVISFLGSIVVALTGIANPVLKAITLYSINGTLARVSFIIAQILLSFAVATLLFAITYKMIPEKRIHWKDVNVAAVTTGIAFTATNYILGAYIQVFTITTIVGAAGSLFIILLWIYILNQIVLFGAEVSKVYATTFGPHPKEHLPTVAEKIVKQIEKAEERIEQAT